MPIDYSDYPKDWPEIRQRILTRAGHKCEQCGFNNYQIVLSVVSGGRRVWVDMDIAEAMTKVEMRDFKEVKVILTIAHLDHDETNENISDDRLMAMCQLCHLAYDLEEKRRRLQAKKCLESGQIDFI